MIIIMSTQAAPAEVKQVVERLRVLEAQPHVIHGEERVVVTARGNQVPDAVLVDLRSLPGVLRVDRVSTAYKLAGRLFHAADSSVSIGGQPVGGGRFAIAAGHRLRPMSACCLDLAQEAARLGAQLLWAGPAARYLEGRGKSGSYLMTLARVREQSGLPLVVGVEAPGELPLLEGLADALHVGPAHMANAPLLKAVASSGLPLVLSRSPSATIAEWLLAADAAMSAGNFQVVLCEQGIRTFETALSLTLDIGAVAALKGLSHLPVMVDPGQALGREDLVPAMAMAAAAGGADGVIMEVHRQRHDDATSPAHSLPIDQFASLAGELRALSGASRAGSPRHGAPGPAGR